MSEKHAKSAEAAHGRAAAMPSSLPEVDRPTWDTMTASQRQRASERLAAFEGWMGGKLGIDAAVAASHLSRSRFYRLAADFRAAPSLAALGAFAGTGGTRSRLNPDAVNALQAVVADVVAMNAGASVSQLVQLMVQDAGVPADALPGTSKLRAIVEDEQRRVAASGEAGGAVRFDCSAINLPRPDGRPYAMFACLDEGTRLILGAAVVNEPLGAVGYRSVAADALTRIEGLRARLPWASRTVRIEISAGTDLNASASLVERLRAEGVRANVQLARVPKRFGRYFRATVGNRIGRIEITPARTETGNAVPDNGDMTPWSLEEAAQAVRVAVEEHNGRILSALESQPGGRTPEDLIRTLELLAKA